MPQDDTEYLLSKLSPTHRKAGRDYYVTQLDRDVASGLASFMRQADRDGRTFEIQSGARTTADQARIRSTARPGYAGGVTTSYHVAGGLAVDIKGPGGRALTAAEKSYMRDNLPTYGLHQPIYYNKSGKEYEPWHVEKWTGVEGTQGTLAGRVPAAAPGSALTQNAVQLAGVEPPRPKPGLPPPAQFAQAADPNVTKGTLILPGSQGHQALIDEGRQIIADRTVPGKPETQIARSSGDPVMQAALAARGGFSEDQARSIVRLLGTKNPTDITAILGAANRNLAGRSPDAVLGKLYSTVERAFAVAGPNASLRDAVTSQAFLQPEIDKWRAENPIKSAMASDATVMEGAVKEALSQMARLQQDFGLDIDTNIGALRERARFAADPIGTTQKPPGGLQGRQSASPTGLPAPGSPSALATASGRSTLPLGFTQLPPRQQPRDAPQMSRYDRMPGNPSAMSPAEAAARTNPNPRLEGIDYLRSPAPTGSPANMPPTGFATLPPAPRQTPRYFDEDRTGAMSSALSDAARLEGENKPVRTPNTAPTNFRAAQDEGKKRLDQVSRAVPSLELGAGRDTTTGGVPLDLPSRERTSVGDLISATSGSPRAVTGAYDPNLEGGRTVQQAIGNIIQRKPPPAPAHGSAATFGTSPLAQYRAAKDNYSFPSYGADDFGSGMPTGPARPAPQVTTSTGPLPMPTVPKASAPPPAAPTAPVAFMGEDEGDPMMKWAAIAAALASKPQQPAPPTPPTVAPAAQPVPPQLAAEIPGVLGLANGRLTPQPAPPPNTELSDFLRDYRAPGSGGGTEIRARAAAQRAGISGARNKGFHRDSPGTTSRTSSGGLRGSGGRVSVSQTGSRGRGPSADARR